MCKKTDFSIQRRNFFLPLQYLFFEIIIYIIHFYNSHYDEKNRFISVGFLPII